MKCALPLLPLKLCWLSLIRGVKETGDKMADRRICLIIFWISFDMLFYETIDESDLLQCRRLMLLSVKAVIPSDIRIYEKLESVKASRFKPKASKVLPTCWVGGLKFFMFDSFGKWRQENSAVHNRHILPIECKSRSLTSPHVPKGLSVMEVDGA